MWFLYLVGIVVAIVIDYIIAKTFEEIAEMKGHEGRAYFWFTFVFGLVGMLMVVALPNINSVYISNLPTVYAAPEQKTSPVVAETSVATEKDLNKGNAPVSAEIIDGEKVCPKCGTKQKASRWVCWSCGQRFDN